MIASINREWVRPASASCRWRAGPFSVMIAFIHLESMSPLLRSITALLYLAPLSLFLYGSKFLFPLATLKVHSFYIIVDLLICAWAFALMQGLPYRPNLKSPLTRALAIFLGALTVAGIFGLDPIQSFFSTPARTIGIVGLWHFFAFYLALATFLTSAEKREKYLRFLFIVASLVALSGVIQILVPGFLFGGSDDRHGGLFDNPIFLAGYLLSFLWVGVFYLFTRSRFSKSVTIVSSLLILGGFWGANTRGAVIGLAAGIFVALALLFFPRKKDSSTRPNNTLKRGIVVGIIALVLIGLFVPSLASRLSTISLADASIANRLTSWHNAWRAFTEHPLLGVGPENFRFVSDQYFDPLVIKSAEIERYFDKPHSVPLEILSTSGALGFISYLYLLFVLVQTVARAPWTAYERALAYAALTGFVVQGLFSFESFGTYLPLFAALGLLAAPSLSREQERSAALLWKILAGCVALVALVGIAWNIASVQKGRTIFLLPATTSAEIFAEQADMKLRARPHHAGNTIALNQYYGTLKDALLQGVPNAEQILTVLESWTTEREPANLTSLGLSYFILFARSDYENQVFAEKAEYALLKARVLRPLDERTLRGLYCLYYTTSDPRASDIRAQLGQHFPSITDENVCLL